MGIDFIEKAAPSFKKSWDRERVNLATSDLFTCQPDRAARSATAYLIDGLQLKAGEWVTVEIHDGVLIARRGNGIVAQFNNPPPELVEAVKASCSIAKGHIDQVHDLAGMVEISLC